MWAIQWDSKLKSGTLGLCDSANYTIKISQNIKAEDVLRATLLHEVMHALYFTYGFKPESSNRYEGEEEVVSFISSGMFDIFCQNTKLAKYIFN